MRGGLLLGIWSFKAGDARADHFQADLANHFLQFLVDIRE